MTQKMLSFCQMSSRNNNYDNDNGNSYKHNNPKLDDNFSNSNVCHNNQSTSSSLLSSTNNSHTMLAPSSSLPKLTQTKIYKKRKLDSGNEIHIISDNNDNSSSGGSGHYESVKKQKLKPEPTLLSPSENYEKYVQCNAVAFQPTQTSKTFISIDASVNQSSISTYLRKIGDTKLPIGFHELMMARKHGSQVKAKIDSCAQGPCQLSFLLIEDEFTNETTKTISIMYPIETKHSKLLPTKTTCVGSSGTIIKESFSLNQTKKLNMKNRILKVCTLNMLKHWSKALLSSCHVTLKKIKLNESQKQNILFEPIWKDTMMVNTTTAVELDSIIQSLSLSNKCMYRIDILLFTIPFVTFSAHWENRINQALYTGSKFCTNLSWHTDLHPCEHGIRFYFENEDFIYQKQLLNHQSRNISRVNELQISIDDNAKSTTTTTTNMIMMTDYEQQQQQLVCKHKIKIAPAFALRNERQKIATDLIFKYFYESHVNDNIVLAHKIKTMHDMDNQAIECLSLKHIARSGCLELPTGEGKTIIGWTTVADLYNSGCIHNVVYVCNFLDAVQQSLLRCKQMFGKQDLIENRYCLTDLTEKLTSQANSNDALNEEFRRHNKMENTYCLNIVGTTIQAITNQIDISNLSSVSSASSTTTAKTKTKQKPKPKSKLKKNKTNDTNNINDDNDDNDNTHEKENHNENDNDDDDEAGCVDDLDCEINSLGQHHKFEVLSKFLCNCKGINCKTLLLFDEAQSAPAHQWRHALTEVCSCGDVPYRLGMSACFDRKDGRSELSSMLMGRNIYSVKVKDLNRVLDNYVICKVSYNSDDFSVAKRSTLFDQMKEKYQKEISSQITSSSSTDGSTVLQVNHASQRGCHIGQQRKNIISSSIARAQFSWLKCVYERSFLKFDRKCPIVFVSSVNHLKMLIDVYNSMVNALKPENQIEFMKLQTHEQKEIRDFIDNVCIVKVLVGTSNKKKVPAVVESSLAKRIMLSNDNNNTNSNKKMTVILATLQKAGAYYDDPSVDSVIFLDKPTDYIQNVGRLRNCHSGMIMMLIDTLDEKTEQSYGSFRPLSVFRKLNHTSTFNDTCLTVYEKKYISKFMK